MEQEEQGACAKKEDGSKLQEEIQGRPSPSSDGAKTVLGESTDNTTSLNTNPDPVQERPPLIRKHKNRRNTNFSRKPNSRHNRIAKREMSKVLETKTVNVKNTMEQIDAATKTGDKPKTTLPELQPIDRKDQDEGNGESIKCEGKNIEGPALPSAETGTPKHSMSPPVCESKSDLHVPTGEKKVPDEMSESDLDGTPLEKPNSPDEESRNLEKNFNQKILELCREIEKSRLDSPILQTGGNKTDTVDTGPSTSGMKNARDQVKDKPKRKRYQSNKRLDGPVPKYYDASLETKMNQLKKTIAEIDALLFQEIERKDKYIRKGYKLTHSVLKFLEKQEKGKK